MQTCRQLDSAQLDRVDIAPYDTSDFFNDVARLTEFRTDAELMAIVVAESFDTLLWMRGLGVRFQLSRGQQAHKVDGRFQF